MHVVLVCKLGPRLAQSCVRVLNYERAILRV